MRLWPRRVGDSQVQVCCQTFLASQPRPLRHARLDVSAGKKSDKSREKKSSNFHIIFVSRMLLSTEVSVPLPLSNEHNCKSKSWRPRHSSSSWSWNQLYERFGNLWLTLSRICQDFLCLFQVIISFYESKYGKCLKLLDEMRDNMMLDIYLAGHVTSLFQMIRSRSLVQYFSPYISADLKIMASSFNTTVSILEDELMALILEGKIRARIDSHNKVKHLKIIFILESYDCVSSSGVVRSRH